VFGIWNHPEAANLTYLGLYALQHRGQETAGIASTDGERMYLYADQGLVHDVFGREQIGALVGRSAIGHVRYSTCGSSESRNAQPLLAKYWGGSLAVAHNGNVTNSAKLKERLEKMGAIFHTSTDSEILQHLIANSQEQDFLEAAKDGLRHLQGSYSMLILRPDCLVAVKDPRGYRPLCIGKLDGATVVASESCAFDIIGATLEREIQAGEMVVVRNGGVVSEYPMPRIEPAFCVFEYVYFARPDSVIHGRSVYEVRKALGRQLAREAPVEADMVLPVPDSSNPAALGYAQETGIPFELGLIRSHYIGRTFIEPRQSIRDFGAKIKYNPLQKILAGKRIVVVDDSIVRGTTIRKIIKMLRGAGALEIHIRVSCPPWRNPCYFGIDTPSKEELLASSRTLEEMHEYIGSDSLQFLSFKGLFEVVGGEKGFCGPCFSGNYPGGRPREFSKEALETPHVLVPARAK
jgi:amidophosphoribosyltransferase